MAPGRGTCFEATKSEGLSQIEEVTNMLKEIAIKTADILQVQTDALADLHLKIKNIQDTADKVGEFANKIRGIQVELGEAKRAAEQIISTNTGMGEIAQEVANIKAKAAEQQSDLILAKDAVDKLIPTNASMAIYASLVPMPPCRQRARKHRAFL